MFSKAKRDKSDERQVPEFEEPKVMAADPGMSRRADAKSSARAKPVRSGPSGVPSLISADMVIRGEIRSEGEVQFDGEIEGDIYAKGLVVGEGATVRGEIMAEKVKVAGTVEGRVRATRVELTASSMVKGDVIHTALMIEAGARFEGSCRHSDDPMSEQAVNAAAAELPAPTPERVLSNHPAPNAPREREAKLREAAPIRRDASAAPKVETLQPMQQGQKQAAKANLR
ncbi:bactofilin family protein [Parvularcula maris]|uniref:Polymer-forming cytoskeletal protein n=1 Tax=Parvularcula maris TaxID=2965077 RepID=A0A9X2LA10_9PROT|nr:polymer-forming cytoskeletal protein [Parvularcula maris]MCQ8185713.1 polymer-forming cytoskeletal protein [Parvularcula maris]